MREIQLHYIRDRVELYGEPCVGIRYFNSITLQNEKMGGLLWVAKENMELIDFLKDISGADLGSKVPALPS
ncbi:hypothetical protein Scep_023951 [Stephania cephalantha]|uniref:Uncharacterized protein n=1 Tax=Stephania cephalantha TaxID=152367 RepID=A0AAP0EVM6_9MAGN